MAAMMASQTGVTLSLLKFRLTKSSFIPDARAQHAMIVSDFAASLGFIDAAPRSGSSTPRSGSSTPRAGIEFESLALALPDDRGSPHRQEPGVLLQGLAGLEARWPKHGHRRAVLGIAHRFIANGIDCRLARHAGEVLRGTVVIRMRPFRAPPPEGRAGQIEQTPVDAGPKNRLRRRSDGLKRVAVDQESPAPKSQFGAGRALRLRAIPNARIG